MPNDTLFVPMQVEGWILNNQVLNAGSLILKRTIRRWGMDHTNLESFDSPLSPPYENEKNIGTSDYNPETNFGAYLHWTLPAGFRHGIGKKDEQTVIPPTTRATSNMDFTPIPNRWLIIRYQQSWSDNNTKAWIIESDTANDAAGTSFPLPDGSGGQKIGRCFELKEAPDEKVSSINKGITLNAVAAGDVTFSAYQPYAQNIFSFCDLLCREKIDSALLSYAVMGWYSNDALDPICKGDLSSFLQRHKLVLEEKVEGSINKIITHGVLYNLQWESDKAIPQSCFDKIEQSHIKMVIGNSSADALVKLIQIHEPNFMPDTLLKALAHGLEQKLDAPDSEEMIDATIHESWFSGTAGALVCHFQGSLNKITREQDAWINQLNAQLTDYHAKQAELAELQERLYVLWWKWGKVNKVFRHRKPNGITNEQFYKEFDKTTRDSLVSKIIKLQGDLNQITNDINESKVNKFKALFGNSDFETVISTKVKNKFWKPADPCLLITGINSPWRKALPNEMPCRIDSQLISAAGLSSATVPAPQDNPIRDMFIAKYPSLAPAVSLLLNEFIALTPLHLNNLSSDNYNAELLKLRDQKPSQIQFNGNFPTYGLTIWEQPWYPLLLQWRIQWQPLPADKWQFNGVDYIFKDDASGKSEVSYASYITGRSLLTPHASFSFKNHLKRSLADPILKSSLEAQNIHVDDLINAIDKWDILSQRLTGIHNALIQKSAELNRVPSRNNNQQAIFPDVKGSITEAEVSDLISGNHPAIPYVDSPSKFQLIRRGKFNFIKLSVVDRYGQTIDIIDDDNHQDYHVFPIPTDSLKSNENLPNDPNASTFIQLPPRILQPMQLKFEWVSALDDKLSLSSDYRVNPVCGWVIPNYMDQCLMIHLPDGQFAGEIFAGDHSPSLIFETTAGFSLERLKQREFSHLYQWITELINQPKSKDVLQKLFDIFDKARLTKYTLMNDNTHFLASMVGHPYALGRAQLAFELEQREYQAQTWGLTFADAQAQLVGKTFPVKIGNQNFARDGLVGYFVGNNYANFCSVYSADNETSNPYISEPSNNANDSILPNCLNISIGDTFSPAAFTYVTLLFDAIQPEIYAYSGILPAQPLKLPLELIKGLQQNIEISFHAGPLLTTLREESNSSLNDKITIPIASRKGQWSWLEYSEDKKWNTLAVQAAASYPTPNMDYEAVAGMLKLNLKKKSPAALKGNSLALTTERIVAFPSPRRSPQNNSPVVNTHNPQVVQTTGTSEEKRVRLPNSNLLPVPNNELVLPISPRTEAPHIVAQQLSVSHNELEENTSQTDANTSKGNLLNNDEKSSTPRDTSLSIELQRIVVSEKKINISPQVTGRSVSVNIEIPTNKTSKERPMKNSLSDTEIISAISEDPNGTNGFSNENLACFLQLNYDLRNKPEDLTVDILKYRKYIEMIKDATKYSIYAASLIISLLGSVGIQVSTSEGTSTVPTTVTSAITAGLGLAILLIKGICEPWGDTYTQVLKRLEAAKTYARNQKLIPSDAQKLATSLKSILSTPASSQPTNHENGDEKTESVIIRINNPNERPPTMQPPSPLDDSSPLARRSSR